MTQRLTCGSRLLASVVAIALAFASTATCLAAVMQTPETSHHACEGMKQDSAGAGSMAVQKDCCVVQSAEFARLSKTAQAVVAPASSLILPLVLDPLWAHGTRAAALDPGIPKPSSSPTYLLVSVFRL